MNRQRLHDLLARLSDLYLLVVGDFFLDYYLVLDAALTEISLETGLEAYQVVATRPQPGAAGTVTNNLRAMGVRVTALGVLGDDGLGIELRRGLEATGVETGALVVAPGRMTPTYTKPMLRAPDGAERELNRLDFKNRTPTPPAVQREIVARLHALAGQVDGIIVADQVQESECGAVTAVVRDALAETGAARPDLVIAADSRARIGAFRNVSLKPNAQEAMAAAGAATVEAAGAALYGRAGRPVFVTIGAKGMLVFTGAGMAHAPGVPVSGPIDIVGAGDAAMAGLASALCAGAAPEEAATVGNLAASVTVQQIGTTGTASREQILHAFEAWEQGE